ncbi:MAG: saccharopine dehydrogenase C-terminal domain-containing protein [Candidatus Eisenbacteria bacterium]
MKALVFGGSGKIGSAVAWDLVKDKDIEVVGITGRRKEALLKTKKWIGSKKIAVHPIDLTSKREAVKLMEKYDVGAIAVPDRHTSYKTVQYAIEAGLNIVDMLEEYHRRPDAYETEGLELPKGMTLNKYGDWLHNTAVKNGVTFVDGMGFAPGLSNVTVGEAIRKLDRAEVAIARVGGIPAKQYAEKHPLRYMITWAFDHVLREYMIKLFVVKNGRVVEVPAIGDRETFQFTKFGKNEQLQCAVTPGMPSFIFSRPKLKEFAEKTIRWPGHFPGIDTLKDCGLLDLKPHDFKGTKIVPREFLLSMITPRLQARKGETDVCVMYNTVVGRKKGKKVRIEYFMWDEADRRNGISSMMRTTGYPVAVAAKLILEGLITQKGIVPPEDCIYGKVYERFMRELKKRNINVLEETKTIR